MFCSTHGARVVDVGDIGGQASSSDNAASRGSSASKPGFQVFAATFNAGNRVFDVDDEDFFHLLETLTQGHEEADLVILGFQEFGDGYYGFADMATKQLWRDVSGSKVNDINSEVTQLATVPEEIDDIKKQLAEDLASYDNKVEASLEDFHTATITKNMRPVSAWTAHVLEKIQEVKSRYPNVKFTRQGENIWGDVVASIDSVSSFVSQVKSRNQIMLSLAKGSLDELDLDEKMVKKLRRDWRKISDAIGVLHKDLSGEPLDGDWSGRARELADKLLRPASLEMGPGHVVVRAEPTPFDSGTRCRVGTHYDTTMYAFTNPWSDWKIVPEEYSSGRCSPATDYGRPSRGCNIDNNVNMECGKVVNLVRFKATRGDVTFRFCALNTHMSFAGTAQERMTILHTTMEETQAAECDSVIFMGDFNSRLHCRVGPGINLPAYETKEEETESSLDFVMNRFKSGDSYSLGGSMNAHFDEMTQMLTRDTVSCFESEKSGWISKETTWEMELVHSRLPGMRVFEAPPNFPPTYKLASREKAAKAKFSRCIDGEPQCFRNPTGKGKHNPAWTDRVLFQNTSKAVVEVLEYLRRPIPASFKSDHIPVVARAIVTPI